ncbi:Uncharacterized protein FKW44_013113 [Caligus rogercresseyi]|uniref:Uncharacterized protein n=1 Tax=Caligus rogercresseyi TaxID=217165 RepID=A0A7T8HKD9_CALRO|nr:Uncharacterized protein FKW44_013113 [Caligus rogercresseyi]
MRIAVHEDLRSKSYVPKVRQMLSEVSNAKIGSQTICPCPGRRSYGSLVYRTASRWTTTFGGSWRGNPTSALTTALSR